MKKPSMWRVAFAVAAVAIGAISFAYNFSFIQQAPRAPLGDAVALGFVFGFLGMAIGIVATFIIAADMRTYTDPEQIAAAQLEIPQDAIDRRWLKELETAFDAQAYQPHVWEDMDPRERARHQAEAESRRWTFRTIMQHARAARGVRLPPEVTVRE